MDNSTNGFRASCRRIAYALFFRTLRVLSAFILLLLPITFGQPESTATHLDFFELPLDVIVGVHVEAPVHDEFVEFDEVCRVEAEC